MLFHGFNKIEENEDVSKIQIPQTKQNLLKPDILNLLNNVTHLEIICQQHPLSVDSLLELNGDTKIKQVDLQRASNNWISLEQLSLIDIVLDKFIIELKIEFVLCIL